MRLTDISINALRAPSKGQVTYIDDTLPGFGVRVSQGGVKSFVLVHGRSRRRTTLGRYPSISLKDARKAAKLLLAERTLGRLESPPMGFAEAVNLYLSTHYPDRYCKPRTRAETKRLLEKHFLPPFRHEQVADVRTDMISRIVDRLLKTPAEARHAFAAVRQFFNWAVRRGYVDRSPCDRLRPPGRAIARDRVLASDEIVQILQHARSEVSTFNAIVQLLLLTGQRRNEISSLELSWVDFEDRTITLPARITKNKRSHTFPFGSLSEVLLKSAATNLALRAETAGAKKPSEILFPARGRDTPFAGWSKAKPDFDKGCSLAHWTLHDLRRTCATNLAALGTPVHVTEKLLNHISGTTGGIVSVYQRHSYLDEMRLAIDAWEMRLNSLVAAERQRHSVLSKARLVDMPTAAERIECRTGVVSEFQI